MKIWNDKNDCVFQGSDGILCVYKEDETDAKLTTDDIDLKVKFALPQYVDRGSFETFIDIANKAVTNKSYDLYLTDINKIQFTESAAIIGPFPATIVLIPGKTSERITVYTNLNDQVHIQEILEATLKTFYP